MRPSFQFHSILAAVLCLSLEFVPRTQAQSEFPPCREDGSPPDGESQCECTSPRLYRGEFRDVDREFSVQLPDGVVARGNCTPGRSFRISLTHPNGGEPGGDFPQNMIWVNGTDNTRRETFQKIANGWEQSVREDSERIHASDLHFDQPEQTTLSSLPALHLKVTRTELDYGRLIAEELIASNPENSIVYLIGMVSPVEQYEKNLKLFKAVVDGFRYVPKDHMEEH